MMVLPALTFCLVLASCSGQLSFRVSPRDAIEAITESVQLTCRLPGTLDNLDMAVALVIEHTDVNGTTSDVASIDLRDGLRTTGSNRTQAVGSISDMPYHLSVTLLEPMVEDSGEYECRLVYLTPTFQPVTLIQTDTLNVSATPPPEQLPAVIPPPSCECDRIWEEIDNIKASLRSGSGASSQCMVSFSAQFSEINGNQIIPGETVVFDSATSNKGDAYSTSTGEFTAPCDGQYYFSVALRSHQDLDAGYVDGVLTAGDVAVARTSTFINSNDLNIALATTGSVVTLAEGQKVKVVIETTSSGYFKGRDYSVFSGYYLFP